MTEPLLNVLFLCAGNSARSIMAEAILSREGMGRFRAFSAGSMPKGELHPITVDVLRSFNFDTTSFRSKGWEEFSSPDAPHLDFVFTVCDNAASEVCPIWPGQPMTAHWGIPDPAEVAGSDTVQHAAFFDAYRMMFNRISLFCALPMRSLEPLSLQARLQAIGRDQTRSGAPQETVK